MMFFLIICISDSSHHVVAAETPSWVPFAAGAMAVLIVRVILKTFQYIWINHIKKPKDYDCYQNQIEGLLKHSKGESVSDDKAINMNAWLHSSNDIDGGLHTIYGPYNNDFGKPGFYKITFRIRGTGFSANDGKKPVVKLEVSESKSEFFYEPAISINIPSSSTSHQKPTILPNEGYSGTTGGQGGGIMGSAASIKEIIKKIPLGHNIIYTQDLAKSHEYKDYKIICYSAGSGKYEYLALVYDKALPQNGKIYFDQIQIRPYMPLRDILS